MLKRKILTIDDEAGFTKVVKLTLEMNDSYEALRSTSVWLVIFAGLCICGLAHAQVANQNEVWLAPRTDGQPGTGTATDPFNVSTQPMFDALLTGYFKNNTQNVTFNLTAGTYYSMGQLGGWTCLSNWKFYGAGMDTTVIKMSGYSYGVTGTQQSGGNCVFTAMPWFETGIEITDLTIDCSWLNFGTTLSGSFTVPAQSGTVSVPVVSSTWATVGKYAYIQRMDTYQVVGIYLVTSVPNGKNVVLQNLQGSDGNAAGNLPTGTLVSGTAVFVGPAVDTCGIDIGAKDCEVERVHVTDSGTPIPECALGIQMGQANSSNPSGDPFELGDGNIISGCLIDNLWGSAGWCIATVSTNPAGNTGTFISAIVQDNVIHSNGMHQGLSSWGTASSTWTNNTVSNCAVGWFVDVGYNQDAQIINNIFENNGTAIQLGGGYVNG